MTETEKWVLINDNGTYFKGMSGMGPMNTDKLEDAEVFPSRLDAARSPATRHMLSFYEVKQIS